MRGKDRRHPSSCASKPRGQERTCAMALMASDSSELLDDNDGLLDLLATPHTAPSVAEPDWMWLSDHTQLAQLMGDRSDSERSSEFLVDGVVPTAQAHAPLLDNISHSTTPILPPATAVTVAGPVRCVCAACRTAWVATDLHPDREPTLLTTASGATNTMPSRSAAANA